MPIATINPATGELVREFKSLSPVELGLKLDIAAQAFKTWRRTPLPHRAACLTKAAEILEAEKEALGRIMTLEMGKPLKSAIDEAAKCATACRYYAEHGERLLSEQSIDIPGQESKIIHQPLGVILAVMPWNFPFWQVFRFLAPTLMAGNTGLLKHASNVPQCALAIEDIATRAGFPEGVFQTLLVGSDQVPNIIRDDRVKAATLTGSEPAGAQVASQCGKLIKKTVLELGGSDPFIVMPSANFENAVSTAVQARCINNGQSCIAAKRFIVHQDIYERFEAAFVDKMSKLVVGDPMDPGTQVGPMATEQIVKDLEDQVKRAVAAGSRVKTGGARLQRPGQYFSPTVITGVCASPVSREEIFGPVATLYRVDSLDAAIDLANDTSFGLGASAWTQDSSQQTRFIDELEAGMVFINGMVASDARLPFGGIKHSGYGRELGPFGILEFVNTKTVVVRPG